MIPEFCNWEASEGRTPERPKAIDDNDHESNAAYALDRRANEDPHVLHNNGDFRHGQTGQVDGNTAVESFHKSDKLLW